MIELRLKAPAEDISAACVREPFDENRRIKHFELESLSVSSTVAVIGNHQYLVCGWFAIRRARRRPRQNVVDDRNTAWAVAHRKRNRIAIGINDADWVSKGLLVEHQLGERYDIRGTVGCWIVVREPYNREQGAIASDRDRHRVGAGCSLRVAKLRSTYTICKAGVCLA